MNELAELNNERVREFFSRSSKKEIKLQASQMCEGVISGEQSAVEMYAIATRFEELAKEIKNNVKDSVVGQLEREYDGVCDSYGSTIKTCAVKTTYDYSCNETWKILNAQVEELKSKMKQLEIAMQTANKTGKPVTVMMDGAMEEIGGCKKTETIGIKVELNK